ncbi:MAG: hypothetical protein HYR55_13960 [Acidobacteria bacterium]|nr:hypothetical protein [Acidobacteriota bacterium]MBI3658482.1 hypothetical protein [Acidobacteriota bacterium]
MEKYLEGGDLTEPRLGVKNLAVALLFLCQIVPDYDRLLPMRKIGFPVYNKPYGSDNNRAIEPCEEGWGNLE